MTSVLDLDVAKQKRVMKEVRRSQGELFENQELLNERLKKLADCFQLDYVEGRYVSKRNLKKVSKKK